MVTGTVSWLVWLLLQFLKSVDQLIPTITQANLLSIFHRRRQNVHLCWRLNTDNTWPHHSWTLKVLPYIHTCHAVKSSKPVSNQAGSRWPLKRGETLSCGLAVHDFLHKLICLLPKLYSIFILSSLTVTPRTVSLRLCFLMPTTSTLSRAGYQDTSPPEMDVSFGHSCGPLSYRSRVMGFLVSFPFMPLSCFLILKKKNTNVNDNKK